MTVTVTTRSELEGLVGCAVDGSPMRIVGPILEDTLDCLYGVVAEVYDVLDSVTFRAESLRQDVRAGSDLSGWGDPFQRFAEKVEELRVRRVELRAMIFRLADAIDRSGDGDDGPLVDALALIDDYERRADGSVLR